MGEFPGKELNPETLGWTNGAETALVRRSTLESNESQDRKGLLELSGEQPGSGTCGLLPVRKLLKSSKRARGIRTQLSPANKFSPAQSIVKQNSNTIRRSASTPMQLEPQRLVRELLVLVFLDEDRGQGLSEGQKLLTRVSGGRRLSCES